MLFRSLDDLVVWSVSARIELDHGTAFDIAGKGLARPDSLIAAIRLAHEIAERRAALVAA